MDEPVEAPPTEDEAPAAPMRHSLSDIADCSRLGQSWRRIDLLACRPNHGPMTLGFGHTFMGYEPSILV